MMKTLSFISWLCCSFVQPRNHVLVMCYVIYMNGANRPNRVHRSRHPFLRFARDLVELMPKVSSSPISDLPYLQLYPELHLTRRTHRLRTRLNLLPPVARPVHDARFLVLIATKYSQPNYSIPIAHPYNAWRRFTLSAGMITDSLDLSEV